MCIFCVRYIAHPKLGGHDIRRYPRANTIPFPNCKGNPSDRQVWRCTSTPSKAAVQPVPQLLANQLPEATPRMAIEN